MAFTSVTYGDLVASALSREVELRHEYEGTGQVRLVATSLAVDGQLYRDVDVTALITASGAGGLDTGLAAGDTWYAVWAVASHDGSALALLLSLSATAPTRPAGYTRQRRVGWTRSVTTTSLRRGRQRDGLFLYEDTQVVFQNVAGNTSYQTQDASAAVPPGVREALMTGVEYADGTAATGAQILRTRETGTTIDSQWRVLIGGPNQRSLNQHWQPLDTSRRFDWRTDTTTGITVTYLCDGWLDRGT